jgi:hypothetical protein
LTLRAERAFFAQLRESIPDWVHPAGAATIDHWIVRALDALDERDFAEAGRLLEMIRRKAELERGWHREDLGAKIDPGWIELLMWLLKRGRN